MTVCLYKCLTVAGLQRHYARFTLMGVYQAVHLLTLRMEDYPLLGVCSMEDRARLFQLVQLVKSLDLLGLTNNDVGTYNESGYGGGDGIFSANNNSFSPEYYGNPDGDMRKDKDKKGAFTNISNTSCCRPPYIPRRLDFSTENADQRFCSHFEDDVNVHASHNRNDDPVHENGSATPIQPRLHDRRAVVCDLQRSKTSEQNELSWSCDSHNGEGIKHHITRRSSVFDSHIRVVPKSESFHKISQSPVGVKSESLTNKPSPQKHRKTISRWKNCSADVTKPISVFEAKTTAGYNYGLPQSSPQTAKHAEGQRIIVCVRKRALTLAERRGGETDVVTTQPNNKCLVVHESKEAVDLTVYILQHRFHFDQVFGEESSNEEVYQKTAYPLVHHMLSGGKATCFAYGQTGAGKTHTMLGLSHGGTGLYALAVRDIFAHLSATREPLLVYVSFFEIYCGQLYDLLEHRKRLFAREDGKKVVHISGLRDVKVDTASSLLEIISQGSHERTQGMSGVNPLSSRSHALLQIQLRDLNQQVAGRMWFVDLAGSERASDAKEANKRSHMEGAEINRSLLALKECIRSLDKEEYHTPFRQSKLTQVLKDSFVGNSMTCMIANISPGHSTTEHTLNTLRYADRVKDLRGKTGKLGGRGGRRRSNMAPANKNDISGSSSKKRNRNIVGTSKNYSMINKMENFSPKTHTTKPKKCDTVFCSTPKKTTCGDETKPRNRNGIELEHISQIRGQPVQSERWFFSQGPDVRRDRGTETESCTDNYSYHGKGKHSRSERMLGQQPKEGVKEGDSAFPKRESGLHYEENENHQQTIKGRDREEPEWTRIRRQVESPGDTCREEDGLQERELHKTDDIEKMRHLREYHQQLQQCFPSPTSSFLHPSSSSTCPSFSSFTQKSQFSFQHSSQGSVSTHTDPCLEGTLDVQTETFANNAKNVAEDKKRVIERTVMAEPPLREEGKRLAGRKGGDMRYSWVGNTKRESQQISTKTEGHLTGGYNSANMKDGNLQRTREPAWTSEQKSVSDHSSRNPQFNSAHLQGIAESLLSPVCDITSKMFDLSQIDTQRDSLRCIVDPPSISQLYTDYEAVTTPFLQGDNSNTSTCAIESEKDEMRKAGKRSHCYVEKIEKVVNDEYAQFSFSPLELPHTNILKINAFPTSDSASANNHHQQKKCIPATVRGRDTSKSCSLQVYDCKEKKQSTLEKNLTASIMKFQGSSFIQNSDGSSSHSSHNTPDCAPDMSLETAANISKQHSGARSGCLNSAKSDYCNNSTVVAEPFNSAKLRVEESSNPQIEPRIDLFTLDKLENARLCIIEAHLEQLKEMEAICKKEGELLYHQNDMGFMEFVHKLSEIMERKALCVHSMRAQLMACLTTNNLSTQEDRKNGVL